MTSWIVLQLVSPPDLSDSVIADAVSLAAVHGWKRRDKGDKELEFDRFLGQKQGHTSFAVNGAPPHRTIDLYLFRMGHNGNRVLALDIDTYFLQGLRSPSPTRRERADAVLASILSFIEQLIAKAKPLYGIADGTASFSTDAQGNSLPPSEDEVVDLLLSPLHKPWIVYLGASMLARMDESKVREISGWRTLEVSNGKLIVTRPDPIELP